MSMATDRLAICAECEMLRGFRVSEGFEVFRCGKLLGDAGTSGCGCLLGSTRDPTTRRTVPITYTGRDGVAREYDVKPTCKTRMRGQQCPLGKWPELAAASCGAGRCEG